MLDPADHAETACIGFDTLFHGSFIFEKGKVGLWGGGREKTPRVIFCSSFFFPLRMRIEKSSGLDLGRRKY